MEIKVYGNNGKEFKFDVGSIENVARMAILNNYSGSKLWVIFKDYSDGTYFTYNSFEDYDFNTLFGYDIYWPNKGINLLNNEKWISRESEEDWYYTKRHDKS